MPAPAVVLPLPPLHRGLANARRILRDPAQPLAEVGFAADFLRRHGDAADAALADAMTAAAIARVAGAAAHAMPAMVAASPAGIRAPGPAGASHAPGAGASRRPRPRTCPGGIPAAGVLSGIGRHAGPVLLGLALGFLLASAQGAWRALAACGAGGC